jgi:hypothetical protein
MRLVLLVNDVLLERPCAGVIILVGGSSSSKTYVHKFGL